MSIWSFSFYGFLEKHAIVFRVIGLIMVVTVKIKIKTKNIDEGITKSIKSTKTLNMQSINTKQKNSNDICIKMKLIEFC